MRNDLGARTLPKGQDMEVEISSEEWRKLDDITAKIYQAPFENLLDTVLESIKELVSYTHSITYLIRSDNELSIGYDFRSKEIPSEHLRSYAERYSRVEFINWYLNAYPEQVFRESDVVPIELREKSAFTKHWMEPIGLYWGVGILARCEGVRYSDIFLYRTKDYSDFSDKDMEMLRIVNRHLGLRFHGLYPEGLNQIHRETMDTLRTALPEFRLTNREKEIIECIKNNTLRSDLCAKLFITENTLNKHFDNIYKKLGINSYEELLQIVKQLR